MCCSDSLFRAYNYNVFSVLPIYKKLIQGGLKIWIYRLQNLNILDFSKFVTSSIHHSKSHFVILGYPQFIEPFTLSHF